jgi:sarcosine oxidase subunit gamma
MSRSPLEPALLKYPQVPAGDGTAAAAPVVSAREQAALRFDDLSARPRFGCKGPGAPAWLAANGYSVPQGANSARVDSQGVLVARLATSEFLIEAVGGGAEGGSASLHQLGWPMGPAGLAARPLDVYPVARQDLVVGIQGPGLQTLLRQICSVDFVPLFEGCGPHDGPVALTSMIGVGVVAWPRRTDSGPSLTVWLDPSFAHYFWTTLLEVGRGVGALVIGSNI